MSEIYNYLILIFNLFKNDLSFIEGDSIVYNDKNDKSFFLIKQLNNEYIVQFQVNAGLQTASHMHTYDKMTKNIAEDLFGEFLDSKKKVKKNQLGEKLDILFFDSECDNVIEDLKSEGYISEIEIKKFEAYSYYEFLYLNHIDISFTCLYNTGNLKIRLYNRESIKSLISIIKISNNNIDLKFELEKLINNID